MAIFPAEDMNCHHYVITEVVKSANFLPSPLTEIFGSGDTEPKPDFCEALKDFCLNFWTRAQPDQEGTWVGWWGQRSGGVSISNLKRALLMTSS